ncbi:MAG: hypothetical protein WC389_18555 [Lutibacter sp.]|jgi:hypothetical protein
MSKRIVLTVSDELNQSLEEMAKDMNISVLEYIKYLILKSKENEMYNKISKELGL